MSNQSADMVFDALGEPVRRRILELLRDGPVPVGELADQLPVGRPGVSKHLRVLSDAGLITHRSVGTRNLYALAPGGLAVAQQWLVYTLSKDDPFFLGLDGFLGQIPIKIV